MVVQHNLTAMNSNRMLGITVKTQAKSTEKLSSGYKINRAADDAAGLAISEKMRKQIRGLTQASLNAQDGISAVQTAEGALTEVHDMIQRMNELAVKSANGTNSKEERQYIQDEIDQLTKEIDRVAETTKFNDIYLLQGEGTVSSGPAGSISVAYNPETVTGDSKLAWVTGGTKVYATLDGVSVELSSSNMNEYFEIKNGAPAIKDGVKFYTQAPVTTNYGAQTGATNITVGSYVSVETDLLVDSAGKAVAATAITAGGTYFDTDGSYKNNLYKMKDGKAVAVGAEQIDDYVTVTGRGGGTKKGDLTLSLHVGAEGNATNKIDITLKAMDATSIGVKGLKVNTKDSATAAIDQLNESLRLVSEQRALLGASQNRLEHTINNLDNVVENTTAAEAQIRDTDMATEMVRYANNQILAQAGQAMLAQSNQANQGVLSLLQ